MSQTRTDETISVLQTLDPKYRVVEVNGIKIGMVCYSYGEINAETGRKSLNGIPIDREYTGLFHVFDYARLELFYEEMEQHLADMKAQGAEATVVFIHWGNEYRTQENDHQQGTGHGDGGQSFQNPGHKVRFCKEKRKTPDTVFKENAPTKLVRRRRLLHLLYIRAKATICCGAVVSVKRTKS